MTNPNNPSGAVWTAEEINSLVCLCRQHGTWLVVDQTYHDFLFDGATHIYPSSARFCPFVTIITTYQMFDFDLITR